MKEENRYQLVVVNEIITDAKSEEEFVLTFNDILLKVILQLESDHTGGVLRNK